jgi:hypothetical protein
MPASGRRGRYHALVPGRIWTAYRDAVSARRQPEAVPFRSCWLDCPTRPIGPADDAGRSGERKPSSPRQYVRWNGSSFPAVATSAPPGVHRDATARDRMDTRFAYPIRDNYPARQRCVQIGIWQIAVAAEACGARVTPVKSHCGQRVILSQRIRSAGRGDHGSSEEIRCAPDLILAQRERADG